VVTAAFVFQIQPLNPGLQPFFIFGQPAKDGKARGDQIALLTRLKEICEQGRITVGGLATDGGSAYEAFHVEQADRNLAFFRKNPTDIPLKRYYRTFSDILHLLKRALPDTEENTNGGRSRQQFDRVRSSTPD
jgi:hypothetical protein